jgi:hypothetical protein
MPRYEFRCFAVVRADDDVEAEYVLSAALAAFEGVGAVEYISIDDSMPDELDEEDL